MALTSLVATKGKKERSQELRSCHCPIMKVTDDKKPSGKAKGIGHALTPLALT